MMQSRGAAPPLPYFLPSSLLLSFPSSYCLAVSSFLPPSLLLFLCNSSSFSFRLYSFILFSFSISLLPLLCNSLPPSSSFFSYSLLSSFRFLTPFLSSFCSSLIFSLFFLLSLLTSIFPASSFSSSFSLPLLFNLTSLPPLICPSSFPYFSYPFLSFLLLFFLFYFPPFPHSILTFNFQTHTRCWREVGKSWGAGWGSGGSKGGWG